MVGAGPARRGSGLTVLAHRRRLVGLVAPSCAVVDCGLFESMAPPEVVNICCPFSWTKPTGSFRCGGFVAGRAR